MLRSVKLAILWVARTFGLFALARRLTAKRLRILCYHGASLRDEHEYEPVLFMRPAVFRRRMEILRRIGLPVVPLDQGAKMLANGGPRNGEVVITIDDGWKSTYTQFAPILKDFEFPATLYVTTF